MGIPRDADVIPDHGKESCGFSIPSCYTALGASRLYFSQGNNPASVFIQTPPGDVGRYGEALGLKVKLWEHPGSVPGGYTVGPGPDPGPHWGPTGTRRAARCISNMSFNAFTLGAY